MRYFIDYCWAKLISLPTQEAKESSKAIKIILHQHFPVCFFARQDFLLIHLFDSPRSITGLVFKNHDPVFDLASFWQVLQAEKSLALQAESGFSFGLRFTCLYREPNELDLAQSSRSNEFDKLFSWLHFAG
ncbi:hypothetical protein IM774_07870 [Erysipelotrichaceae bacterium RD49]|nr:hypothetical protein [Erysipelotrichaceae bacterium RD49]